MNINKYYVTTYCIYGKTLVLVLALIQEKANERIALVLDKCFSL